MSKQLEEQLHRVFHDWYILKPKIAKYMFCVEHGGVRNPVVGAKLKRKGVRRGMADYLYLKPNKHYSSLWIEFKVGKNKQSEFQIEFQRIVEETGGKYVICRSLEDALTEYYKYKHNL